MSEFDLSVDEKFIEDKVLNHHLLGEYFEKDIFSDKKVMCKLCETSQSHSRSTSNLLKHVKKVHSSKKQKTDSRSTEEQKKHLKNLIVKHPHLLCDSDFLSIGELNFSDLYEASLKRAQNSLRERECFHIILNPFSFNLVKYVQIDAIFLNSEFQPSKINLGSIALCSSLDDRDSADKIFNVLENFEISLNKVKRYIFPTKKICDESKRYTPATFCFINELLINVDAVVKSFVSSHQDTIDKLYLFYRSLKCNQLISSFLIKSKAKITSECLKNVNNNYDLKSVLVNLSFYLENKDEIIKCIDSTIRRSNLEVLKQYDHVNDFKECIEFLKCIESIQVLFDSTNTYNSSMILPLLDKIINQLSNSLSLNMYTPKFKELKSVFAGDQMTIWSTVLDPRFNETRKIDYFGAEKIQQLENSIRDLPNQSDKSACEFYSDIFVNETVEDSLRSFLSFPTILNSTNVFLYWKDNTSKLKKAFEENVILINQIKPTNVDLIKNIPEENIDKLIFLIENGFEI